MLRPLAIAGVSLLSVGLVAGAATSVERLQSLATARDVALTSGESDLLTPWIDQFNTASQNTTALLNAFFEAPGVGWQQWIANQSGYLQEFFNDPTSGTVASVSHEMQANLAAVLTGLPLQDATLDTTNTVLHHTVTADTAFYLSIISSFLPSSVNPAEVTPIINFLASPDSGLIMGMLGPDISPWIALGNSITDGDDLSTTLANMVGAYFNGADLNLDSLIPAIEAANIFPAGMNMENLGIAFGGLLSPGDTYAGVGGSIFNSIDLELTGVPQAGTLTLTGEAVGPIGAWEGMAQTIASLLGWDGSGSPLADVTLPIIPTDFLDGGTGAATAATDLSSLVQDLISGLGL